MSNVGSPGGDKGGGAFVTAPKGVNSNSSYTLFALSLSVVSSVSIVLCNKALFSGYGYQFATSLSGLHMAFTLLSLQIAARIHLFVPKPLPVLTCVLFGCLNGASVGLLNLSLGFNSVGFYQMTKLAIIPFTVLIQSIFFEVQFSVPVQLSLLVLLAGVGIATVTDLQLNFIGSVLSLLAILATCLSQIYNNTLQSQLQASSTQLLHQSVPYMAIILLVTGPFLDYFLTSNNVFAFNYGPFVILFIFLSCCLAALVNLSTFMVIGLTSPVTYQVLGHLKTCLVLALGYSLFHAAVHWRNILGILTAVLGMIVYTFLKSRDAHASKAAEAAGAVAASPSSASSVAAKQDQVRSQGTQLQSQANSFSEEKAGLLSTNREGARGRDDDTTRTGLERV